MKRIVQVVAGVSNKCILEMYTCYKLLTASLTSKDYQELINHYTSSKSSLVILLCVVTGWISLVVRRLRENSTRTEVSIRITEYLLKMRPSSVRSLHSSAPSVISVLKHVIVLRILKRLNFLLKESQKRST